MARGAVEAAAHQSGRVLSATQCLIEQCARAPSSLRVLKYCVVAKTNYLCNVSHRPLFSPASLRVRVAEGRVYGPGFVAPSFVLLLSSVLFSLSRPFASRFSIFSILVARGALLVESGLFGTTPVSDTRALWPPPPSVLPLERLGRASRLASPSTSGEIRASGGRRHHFSPKHMPARMQVPPAGNRRLWR